MGHGHTLSFHYIDTHSSRVQQDVSHVIVEEVYLIYVENAPIGGRQDARFQGFDAFFDSRLNIQRANNPVFRGTQRQIYYRSLTVDLFYQVFLALLKAKIAHLLRISGIAVEGTVLYNQDVLQKIGKSAHGG